MDLRQQMSKWNGKMTKERWLFLLCIGVILMILAFPAGSGGSFSLPSRKTAAGASAPGSAEETAVLAKKNSEAMAAQIPQTAQTARNGMSPGTSGGGAGGSAAADGENSQTAPAAAKAAGESAYEAQLEARVKEILKTVDGVGKVDVMIVLKSSEEKVYRVDKSSSASDTKEQDSQGGLRTAQSSQSQESTVMTGGGSSQGSTPFLEKELRPEISGIVVSAEGGGSPTVKAEISAAMEALFGLPPHKIKVLKRVE